MNNHTARLLWATRNRWPLWLFGTLLLVLLALPAVVLTSAGKALDRLNGLLLERLHKWTDRHFPPTKEALAVAAEIVEVQDALDEAAEQDRAEVRALLRHPNEFN